jgi:histidyl-tRNA synthetase
MIKENPLLLLDGIVVAGGGRYDGLVGMFDP